MLASGLFVFYRHCEVRSSDVLFALFSPQGRNDGLFASAEKMIVILTITYAFTAFFILPVSLNEVCQLKASSSRCGVCPPRSFDALSK